MASPTNNNPGSAFKRAQVRYRKQDDTNAEWIDFSNPEDGRIHALKVTDEDAGRGNDYYQGPVYGLDGFPGFIYAPQALSAELQLQLAYQSVSEFCEAPHATNIDGVPPKASEVVNTNESMWELWKREDSNARTTRDNNNSRYYRCFRKLSWATCGYQYDWTARAYREECKSPMPLILQELSTKFATTSFLLSLKQDVPTFTPSACIVNYYKHAKKSIMGGHRDDLELAVTKPVISFSMGLPAIFLLGGKTKDDTPVVPIVIRPGDVLILGGDCRMNYHGMARVLATDEALVKSAGVETKIKSTADAMAKATFIPDGDRNHLSEFLRQHRININVRQVLPDGMDSIPDQSS